MRRIAAQVQTEAERTTETTNTMGALKGALFILRVNMRINKSYSSTAASLTGYASNVTGAAFTLSANDAGDSLAHKVTIRNDSATNHTGKTVTLVGTGYNGAALTEVVTGPNNAATVTSTNYFLTLTSATPSATIGADTFDIGYAADAITPPVNVLPTPGNGGYAIGISVDATGTPAYSLQQNYGGASWYAHASIATKTADADGSILFPVQAVRLIFTAASVVTLNLVISGQ